MKVPIELIKWMCDKADGFEFRFTGTLNNERVYYNHGSIHPSVMWEDLEAWMFYPLLLQRAIEGVNEKSDDFFIDQTFKRVYVNKDELDEAWFNIGVSADAAKLSALEYIHNQETNI